MSRSTRRQDREPVTALPSGMGDTLPGAIHGPPGNVSAPSVEDREIVKKFVVGQPLVKRDRYIADNFDEIFRAIVTDLYLDPQFECRPRGQLVREMLAPTLCLTNPRARLIASPARAANYRFATGEFLWYLRGARDLESIEYYNPRMRDWSDDGRTLNSAYGAILESQWGPLVNLLTYDSDTRRAIATIYTSGYLTRETKDVPCTVALHFFIRARKLHLHVHMRSNDVIWGLTNDLFSFTLLQEWFLLVLRRAHAVHADLELGNYYHTDGSLHLYERHFEMAEKIVSETNAPTAPMPPINGLVGLDMVQHYERRLRNAHGMQVPAERMGIGAEAWMLKLLNEHRRLQDGK